MVVVVVMVWFCMLFRLLWLLCCAFVAFAVSYAPKTKPEDHMQQVRIIGGRYLHLYTTSRYHYLKLCFKQKCKSVSDRAKVYQHTKIKQT